MVRNVLDSVAGGGAFCAMSPSIEKFMARREAWIVSMVLSRCRVEWHMMATATSKAFFDKPVCGLFGHGNDVFATKNTVELAQNAHWVKSYHPSVASSIFAFFVLVDVVRQECRFA